MKKLKLFQKFATAVFLTFLSVLIFVVVFAFSKKSNGVGYTMARIQEMRVEHIKKSYDTVP